MKKALKVESYINCSTADCRQCQNGKPLEKELRGYAFGCFKGKELCDSFKCIHQPGLFICKGCKRSIRRA